ncbi:hypothetical protein J6590_094603 [Homalodisca vitripennis]|nr:hypothetical protein J6590_094603 [Homalodisca vitripennis]
MTPYISSYKEEERKLLGHLDCTNFTSNANFYDLKDFNKIEVCFDVDDEPEAYGGEGEDNPIKQAITRYREGIKAGVYTSLWKDREMKTCKYLDCTNLTSHGDAWDVRDCDKIQVSFLIDPFTNEREKVEGEEPRAKKSHWLYIKVNSREDVRVSNVFGQMHVYLYDGEHSLTFNKTEWIQFVNNLLSVYIALRDLFSIEVSAKTVVRCLLAGEKEEEVEYNDLPSPIAHRLSLEIELFKRWPNGGDS